MNILDPLAGKWNGTIVIGLYQWIATVAACQNRLESFQKHPRLGLSAEFLYYLVRSGTAHSIPPLGDADVQAGWSRREAGAAATMFLTVTSYFHVAHASHNRFGPQVPHL